MKRYYYIDKCQVLVDIYLNQPVHIHATQEMIDELKEEGFFNEKGKLTEQGKMTAKVIYKLFKFVEEIK